MKLYIAGQKYFGREVFRLARRLGHDVVGVSSPAYRDAAVRLAFGHGDEPPDRLRADAQDAGVPWLEAGNLRAETLPGGVDLIIAAHSYDFIGRKTRNRARLGAIGYHPSLLPLHRGRDAVRWAIKMRERVTGGTVFWLNDTVDGGPVAAQDYCFIRPDDTPDTLWRRELQPMGLNLIEAVLGDIERGYLVRIPQDPALATWEPALDAPPLYRPDLLMLGGVIPGYTVVSERAALSPRLLES